MTTMLAILAGVSAYAVLLWLVVQLLSRVDGE
jgi:hypothetical protein